MKTSKRILFVLAALGLFGTLAHAQDNPPPPGAAAPPPAVERPAAPPQPQGQRFTPPQRQPVAPPQAPPAPTVEAPDVEAPDVEAPDNDAAADDDEPRIVWDRDEGRDRQFPPWRRNQGNSDELVAIGGNSTLEAGRRAEVVVSVFGSSTSRGEVRDAVVSVFGNTRVEAGEVREAAVAVFGDNYVNASVGEVVAVLGNVELGPKANVGSNVVVIGGSLTRDPAAIVRGGIQHIMGLPAGASTGLQSWVNNCLAYLRPLGFDENLGWAWGIALGFLALYALIGALFREPVDRGVKLLREQPGQTALASILALILTPVLFFVIGVTFVLIPIIPIVGFGMMLATAFGKAVVLAWIGRSLLRSFDEEDRWSPALAVLVGGAIVLLLYVVPILGFIVYNLFGILAFGVVVYMLVQGIKQRRRNSPPPAGFGPRPSGTPGGTAPGGATMGTTSEGFASTTNAYGATSASGSEPAYGAAGSGAAFTASAEGISASGNSPGPDPAFGSASFAGDSTASGPGAGPGSGGGSGNGGPGGTFGPAYAGGPGPSVTTLDALSAPRAGFWIRMLALAIDVVIIGVAFSLLDHSHKLQLVALAAYGAIMWKLKGTTVGGIVCNLRVARLDGREIDWSTAIVRALGCFLSLIILGLGFIWIAFDEGKQSWHDKIAGTVVVRVPQGVSLL